MCQDKTRYTLSRVKRAYKPCTLSSITPETVTVGPYVGVGLSTSSQRSNPHTPLPPLRPLISHTYVATHLTRLFQLRFQLESMFARRVPRRPFLLAARARSTAAMFGELLGESSSSRWRAT